MTYTDWEFNYFAKAVVKALKSGRYVESSHNKGYTPWISSGEAGDRTGLEFVEIGGRAATELRKV